MPVPASPVAYPNNNKELKYLKAKEREYIVAVARALKREDPVGEALRALIRRVRDPLSPLEGEDLETMLMIGLAEIWARTI